MTILTARSDLIPCLTAYTMLLLVLLISPKQTFVANYKSNCNLIVHSDKRNFPDVRFCYDFPDSTFNNSELFNSVIGCNVSPISYRHSMLYVWEIFMEKNDAPSAKYLHS